MPVPVPVSHLEHLAAALASAGNDERGQVIADLMADAVPASMGEVLAKLRALSWCCAGPADAKPATVADRIIDSLIRAVQPGAPLGQ